jgi:hypothetical protein
MESILSDGTHQFDVTTEETQEIWGRVFPIRVRLPAGAPQVGDGAGATGPGAIGLLWPEPPAPPEPPDPLGPDHPPAPRPEPLPWPDEPDWKRPVEIRFELEGHPSWPGW